jgi:hypothetical protein
VKLSFATAVVLAVPAVLAQPWFGRTSVLLAHTPQAVTKVLDSQPGGRLFNEVGYGSYLVWAIPEKPVFIDPRMELFPEQIWIDYVAVSEGRDAVQTLDRYGVDWVLLSRRFQPRLSSELGASGRWVSEYVDQEAELWRNAPAAFSISGG